jgi:O-antigen/teichoic acid export membrane protein
MDKAVRGGLWLFSLRITQQLLIVVRLVILARLLSPNDFGLMGMALLTMTVIESLTQTGFDIALIQRKERTEEYLDSAWTVEILRGLALFGILQLLASPAAGFFGSPDAEMLIRVVGLSLVFRGFLNIGTVYFRKELEFGKQFAFEFSGRVGDFIVAVVAGFILKNAWVLVLAYISADLIRVVASYVIHPYRPRFRLEVRKARELFDFGKWILGSSALVFFLNRGDKALVGRLLGATMLGLYEMAYKISNLSASEFTLVISQVTIPAYSKLQERIGRLREGYLRVLQVTAFLAIPLAGLIVVLAPEITRILLGEKWLAAIPAMRALALGGALRSIVATTGPVYMGTGNPRTMAKYQAVQLAILALLVFPLTRYWGIVGTALAVTLAAVIPSGLFLRGVIRITDCPAAAPLKLLAFPAAATAAACVPVVALKAGGVSTGTSLPQFALLAGLYIAIYLALTHFAGSFWGYRVTPLVREVMDSIRRR